MIPKTPDLLVLPPKVLLDDRLSLRHIRVLMALFLHRNLRTTNVVFPSRTRLAELTGYPETRISRITADLERLGWLEKSGKGGRSRATRYTLKETVTDSVTVTETETVTELDLNGDQNGNLNGDQNGHGHRRDNGRDQEETIPLAAAGNNGDSPKPKSFKQWTLEDFKADVQRANAAIQADGTHLHLAPAEIEDFIGYWTEPTASGRFRMSLEKTWDSRRRIHTAMRLVYANHRGKNGSASAKPKSYMR